MFNLKQINQRIERTFQEVITATFQKLDGEGIAHIKCQLSQLEVNVQCTIDYKLNLGELVVEVE